VSYSADPVRYDHSAVIGDTYQVGVLQVGSVGTDGTVTPYSLAGASGVASVKQVRGGSAVLSPTVTITDAANGRFTWSDTAAHTAALSPGDYEYAVRLTFADGSVRTIVYGTVHFLGTRI
jgi:hypothetical protein